MATQPIEVTRAAGRLGAEVRGVDLCDLDDPTFEALHRAFLEHHVLVFRDQKLNAEQLVGFGRRWGPLFVHPIVPHLEGVPEVVPIRNLGKRHTITEVWHSDVSFSERPPMASALYALEVPEAGGDTLFANQHAAYEGLSAGLQRMLDGLRAIHTGSVLGALAGKGGDWKRHGQRHPVVRTHPETGRKALYVSPGFTVAFEDMRREESLPLLEVLWDRATRPDVTFRHRWRVGDLVMWDNRSVMHYAIHDHGDAPRVLHRITVEGDVPA
ncbi:MAG: TauD/TfdA dioxygenase family protein [Myxococcota bacterium]